MIVGTTGDRPYFHDFGDRLWGERIEHTYRIENREGRPIVIHDLLPDCSCTQPRVAYRGTDGERVAGPRRTQGLDFAIPAGATAEVTVELDTTRIERPNQHKLAQVRIRSDSAHTPYLTLELHVLVKRSFRCVPAEIVLSDVPQAAGKTARGDITVETLQDRSRIRGIELVEGPFHAALEETPVAGETLWILTVTADPGLTLGAHTGKVVLGTTNPDGEGIGQHFDVPVRAQVVEEYVINPRILQIQRGPTPRLEGELVALVPGARVRIDAARFEGLGAEHLAVEWQPVAPDDSGRAQRWKFVVTTTAPLPPELLYGKLLVDLDDPAKPRVDVQYSIGAR